jgi:hypothetical protein
MPSGGSIIALGNPYNTVLRKKYSKNNWKLCIWDFNVRSIKLTNV